MYIEKYNLSYSCNLQNLDKAESAIKIKDTKFIAQQIGLEVRVIDDHKRPYILMLYCESQA